MIICKNVYYNKLKTFLKNINIISLLITKNKTPHNMNTIINVYYMIRNCSPVLLLMVIFLYLSFFYNKLYIVEFL